MSKEQEVMNFLHTNVFDLVLNSKQASNSLKAGVRMTITRMNSRDAVGMVKYFWAAIMGTEKGNRFAEMMRAEGFTRFEEVLVQFRTRFNDKWLAL